MDFKTHRARRRRRRRRGSRCAAGDRRRRCRARRAAGRRSPPPAARRVDDGDFALQGRPQRLRCTGVGRREGPRLVFAYAADGRPGGLAQGRGQPGWPCSRAAAPSIWRWLCAGAAELDAALAEALVAAVTEAVYLYRATKPSAPPASRAAERDACSCAKARGGRRRRPACSVARASPPASTLARECANRPGNHCTPSYLAAEAKKLAKAPRIKVEVLDRKALRKARHGQLPGRGPGLGRAAEVHRAALQRRRQGRGAGGAGRQGHHLRHRRHLAQAGAPRWTR